MDFTDIVSATESHLVGVYKKFPVCFTHGAGCKLYDAEGKEYIDFLAGIAVNALGYADSEIAEAVSAQARKLCHVSNLFYNEQQALLLSELAALSGYPKCFLANSGAEANEAAVKLARKYFYERGENRFEIVALQRSFHGRTLMTATLTGQEKYSKPYAPLPPGVIHVEAGDEQALARAVTPRTAAVLLEPIQGEAGVIDLSDRFLAFAAKLCKERGVLLIADEIQTGMGRTGKFLACEHAGIRPDIVTLAKALGGGLPLGAMLTTDEIAAAFHPGDHGTTFGGNPVSCAAGLVVLKRLAGGLLQQTEKTGGYFGEKLADFAARHADRVCRCSGRGLLRGMQLAGVEARAVSEAMLEKGYIVNATGDNVLRFAPPLIITPREIDGMLTALDKTMEETL